MRHDCELIAWAADQAALLLASLESRWAHTQDVTARARVVATVLGDEADQNHLIAAAYLHDVGHSPVLRKTGFHPLDGGRYLRAAGHKRLAGLVAHHSEARFQAELLGHGEALAEFPREASETADALTYCDLTTGPSGGIVTFEERIEELFNRYPPDDVVLKALRRAMPHLAEAVQRTERRLARVGVG
jgi:hypothetical protein